MVEADEEIDVTLCFLVRDEFYSISNLTVFGHGVPLPP